MGFKTFPEAKFEDITFKDQTEFSQLVTRLGEIGMLTPEEVLTAMESGRLPSAEESVEHQQTFKELKDKGLYQPVQGGIADQLKLADTNNKAAMEQMKVGNDAKLEQQKITNQVKVQQKKLPKANGRPPGGGTPTKVRKKTKKLTPIGAEIDIDNLQDDNSESE
jgi:hypothetical protein